MKKYLGFLICLLVLNACDDGDLTFESFDFSEITASNCDDNNLVFKINDNEALIVEINNTQNPFPFRNEIGATPRVININASNKITYRTFSNTVTSAYFCSTIPPASPTVTSEWRTSESSGGTIEITTSLVASTTTAADAKFQHSIIFRNITLTNSEGATMTYEELNFGTYQTKSNVKFNFGAVIPQRCGETDTFFKVFDTNIGNDADKENLNEVLELKIPTNLFPTNLSGVSDKIFLNQSTIAATYRIYNGDVVAANYCNSSLGLPVLFEEWKAENGVDSNLDTDDTGYIIITAGPAYVNNNQLTYTITYQDFTFVRVTPAITDPLLVSKFVSENHNFGTITF